MHGKATGVKQWRVQRLLPQDLPQTSEFAQLKREFTGFLNVFPIVGGYPARKTCMSGDRFPIMGIKSVALHCDEWRTHP
jgi:hypothetical protein